MKNDMTTPQALKILKEYNDWRKGKETEMLNPKTIGKAIDKAIEILIIKARILDDLKNKAKEADAESDRISASDREGGFEKSGEATGLEIAIEVVEQYMP